MASTTITAARPYAKAVFEMAQARNDFASWSDMLRLAAALIEQPEVSAFLTHPKVTADRKAEALLELCQTSLPQLTEEGKNFIRLLSEQRRLSLLPDITAAYEAHRREAEKVISVDVATAFPLNDVQQNALTTALTKRLGANITLENTINKSVIGGAVIRMGDRVIDGSLRGKLEELATQLTA